MISVDQIAERVEPYRLLYVAVTGSRLYGTHRPDSDYDVRAVYAASRESFLRLSGPPETISGGVGEDFVAFELGKFVHLSLAANPNVMEWWWADQGTVAPTIIDPTFGSLLGERRRLISEMISATFGGFARSQMNRVLNDQAGRLKPATRRKHLMHTFRLLESGIQAARTGDLDPVVRNPERLARLSGLPVVDLVEHFERLATNLDDLALGLPERAPDEDFDHYLINLRHKECS